MTKLKRKPIYPTCARHLKSYYICLAHAHMRLITRLRKPAHMALCGKLCVNVYNRPKNTDSTTLL